VDKRQAELIEKKKRAEERERQNQERRQQQEKLRRDKEADAEKKREEKRLAKVRAEEEKQRAKEVQLEELKNKLKIQQEQAAAQAAQNLLENKVEAMNINSSAASNGIKFEESPGIKKASNKNGKAAVVDDKAAAGKVNAVIPPNN
jgi:hypothetical protein